jgi:hypothetical protein
MFQSSKNLMRVVLDIVDDMLVGAPAPEPEPDVVPHPHQRTAQLRLQRRPGAPSPRAMHCLSPGRSPTQPTREPVA